MAARIRDLQDLLKRMIQNSADTTPENPAEVLNGYQSGDESLVMTESVEFRNVGHGPVYVYQGSIQQGVLGPFAIFWSLDAWNEAQYS